MNSLTSTTVYKASDFGGSRQGALVAMLDDRRELSNKHNTAWFWSDLDAGYCLMATAKGLFVDTVA